MQIPPIATTTIGSFPRPRWLASNIDIATGVKVRSTVTFNLEGELLNEGMDDATTVTIRDQERAGLDFVSDGEWRRETYIDVIAEICHGFEWIERELFGYHQVVTSAIRPWQPGIVAAEARFLRHLGWAEASASFLV